MDHEGPLQRPNSPDPRGESVRLRTGGEGKTGHDPVAQDEITKRTQDIKRGADVPPAKEEGTNPQGLHANYQQQITKRTQEPTPTDTWQLPQRTYLPHLQEDILNGTYDPGEYSCRTP